MPRKTILPSAALLAVVALGAACQGMDQPAGTQIALAQAAPATRGEPAPVAAAKPPTVFDAPQAVGTMATCPIMGGTFAITASSQHSEYQGKHVYFCCPGCKPQFDADPQKYLK